MNDPRKILKEIESIRKVIGITQYELVENTSFTKGAIRSFSSGKHMPGLNVLCEVCDYMGLDIVISPRQKIVADPEKQKINLKID